MNKIMPRQAQDWDIYSHATDIGLSAKLCYNLFRNSENGVKLLFLKFTNSKLFRTPIFSDTEKYKKLYHVYCRTCEAVKLYYCIL